MQRKCSICHKEDAVIFIEMISDDKIEKKGICPKCAIAYLENNEPIEGFEEVDEKVLESIKSMKSSILELVNNLDNLSSIKEQKQKNMETEKCPNCHSSLLSIKRDKMMGCPQCYEFFHDYVENLAFSKQRGLQHRGKMPESFVKFYVLKKETRYLKNLLRRLLSEEKYEQASSIQKKLQKLLGNNSSGFKDGMD